MGRWERNLRPELVKVAARVKAAQHVFKGNEVRNNKVGPSGKVSKINFLRTEGSVCRSDVRVVSRGVGWVLP